MSSNDDALIEKAARVLRQAGRDWERCGYPDPAGLDSHEFARAVLDAIGDDLRAEVLERAATTPDARLSGHGGVSVRWLQHEAANYRRERA